MTETWQIEGNTFLITGGGSGLGALYAEELLKEGAKKIAILDISEELGKATADRLNKTYSDKVFSLKCDVSKEEEITTAFETVVDKYKQVDVIINNAGIMDDSPASWRMACDVNYKGVISLTMKGLEHMRLDKGGAGGTIVNVSSNGALIRWRYLPIYGASKMGVLHFTRSLAVEPFYEQTGVRMLVFCLGATDTPLVQNLEMRTYDLSLGKEFMEQHTPGTVVYQKPSSGAAAFITTIKEGKSGSIWTSFMDKPALNLTPLIDNFFEDFEKLLLKETT